MSPSLKPEEKAKKFLRDVMGQETYDKFLTDGKIEIKSSGCTYELIIDGRVVNKTKNQSYCIVLTPGTPDRDNIPSLDIIAIKYAWLKYRTNTVEIIANKTNIHNPHEIEPGRGGIATYDEFVRHMDAIGWSREPLTIHEYNSDNLASTYNINAGETGSVIELRAPTGRTITIIGTQQVPRSPTHRLTVRLSDAQDNEINPETYIEIVKVSPSGINKRIDRLSYSRISPVRNNLYTKVQRRYSGYYVFRDGIWLRSNDTLRVDIINPDKDVKNIKYDIGMDLWSR